jgi:hypothetical protein
MKIYHYTSIPKILSILSDLKIKFGDFQNTNDPKEYFDPWISVFLGCCDSDQDKLEINKEMQKYKLLCFSQNTEFKGYEHPRMWTQYAQNHEGCCIEFDTELLNSQIEKYKGIYSIQSFNSEVNYTNKLMELKKTESESAKEFINRNFKYLFFTKSLDWQQESEYRYIIYSENSQDICLPLEKCISGFYFSHRIPLIIKEKIIQSFPLINNFNTIDWYNGICSISETHTDYISYIFRTIKNVFKQCLFFNIESENLPNANPEVFLPILLANKSITNDEYSVLWDLWTEYTCTNLLETNSDVLNDLRRRVVEIIEDYEDKRKKI